MKFSVIISAFSLMLIVASCDMDGANNPANSAESPGDSSTGMEMTGAPANPVTPADTSGTSSGNSMDTSAQ